MPEWLDIVVRILAGVGLGSLLGMERQFRASTAGIRTNALVSLGATLFVIMGHYGFDGEQADPTRVAAQVVSGVGFLGAGAIMKQGISVTGLNTAATLWAAAAVGTLAGAGLIWVAAIGAWLVAVANMLLRPIGEKILSKSSKVAEQRVHRDTQYTLEVRCLPESEIDVRIKTVDAVLKQDFNLNAVSSTRIPEDQVVISLELIAHGRNDEKVEALLHEIGADGKVLGTRWTAQNLNILHEKL